MTKTATMEIKSVQKVEVRKHLEGSKLVTGFSSLDLFGRDNLEEDSDTMSEYFGNMKLYEAPMRSSEL
jgi:hypothetical protein